MTVPLRRPGPATQACLVKLHQAGEHLLHGGRTAAQVSETLGFADESGFHRSFKAVTGMAPLEYVHRYREQRSWASSGAPP